MTEETNAALRANFDKAAHAALRRSVDIVRKASDTGDAALRAEIARLGEELPRLTRERDALRAALEQARDGLSMMVGQDMFDDQTDDDLVLLFCGPKVAREVYTLKVKDIRRAQAALKAAKETLK